MVTYFHFIVGLLLCILLYRRYFPVRGIPCKITGHDKTSTVVLDIRDYNMDTNQDQTSMHIPYAYLKRFVVEIPHQTVHVIATDRLELNLGLRFLRSRGYKVVSYQISNCPCREKE